MIKMTKDEILEYIKENGAICSANMDNETHNSLIELFNENKIMRLSELNLKFMNESYLYLLYGNPYNLRIVTDGAISTIQKGNK